jgi:hypothetical protein
MDARRSPLAAIIFLFSGAAILAPTSRAQVRVPDLQAQFDRESNPVRKAKLLQKLGDSQFQEIHREQARENYDAVDKIYETYRDNV